MKKLILLLMAFAALANGAAWGQKPFYGEWCYKSSGELIYKVWDNGKVTRSEMPPKKNASSFVCLIFGKDSVCMIFPQKKFCAVFKGDEMKKQAQNMNAFGMEVETVSSSGKKEFIKSEMVSGFMCKHYRITNTTVVSNKTLGETVESTGGTEVWETPEISHLIQEAGPVGVTILKNIVVGAQPAHLFTIPKDYKRVPGSVIMGMMQQIMGDPEENKQKIQESRKNLDKFLKGEKTSDKKVNDWMEDLKKAEEMLKKKK